MRQGSANGKIWREETELGFKQTKRTIHDTRFTVKAEGRYDEIWTFISDMMNLYGKQSVLVTPMRPNHGGEPSILHCYMNILSLEKEDKT